MHVCFNLKERSHCMYTFCIFQLNACEIFIHFVEYRFNRIFYRTLKVNCYCMIQATNLNWKGSCLRECLDTMCFKKLNALLQSMFRESDFSLMQVLNMPELYLNISLL